MMWQRYEQVSAVSDVLALLAKHRERARVIAGGTDLLIELERGQRVGVEVLIDISRVGGLGEITLRDGQIILGAGVTHNQVVASDLLRTYALPLVQAAWEVGAPQIRNRATIAGNIITASPANDTICPLIALGASVTLASLQGERCVPLTEFYTGLRCTVMRPDEMLTAITFPAMHRRQRGMFIKLGLRRAQAISVVNTTVIVSFAEDGSTIEDAAVALGSVAPTIIRVPNAEQALIGQPLTPPNIAAVAKAAANTPSPISDVRSTAEYRVEMIRVLVKRALQAIANGTYADTLPEDPAMLWGKARGVLAHPLTETVNHDYSQLQPIETMVNGQRMTIASGYEKTLLHFLRDDVGLVGTKEGCSEGECGACTVFLDGVAVMACMVAAPRAHQAEIITVEGLKTGDELHPLQVSFIAQNAVQCGYCTPGFLMAGAKLLEEHAQPTQAQIQQSISGNLCRCTGYYKIVNAIIEASQKARSVQYDD